MTIKIAVCDDDTIYSQRIANLLVRFCPEQEKPRVTLFQNGAQLVTAVQMEHHPFDLIVLDIEMPLLDGLSAAKIIRGLDPQAVIVFLSGFIEYSHAAHKAQPYDYLLKLSDPQTLYTDLLAAYRACRHYRNECLVVEKGGLRQAIALADILYIASIGHELVVHTPQQTYSQWHRSLASVAAELSQQGFFRIHKSYLVNLEHISAYNSPGRFVLVSNGAKLPVSRNYAGLDEALYHHRREIVRYLDVL